MSLPVNPNTTCDIYRQGNAPPANADEEAVPCVLTPAFAQGMHKYNLGVSATPAPYTHLLLLAVEVDVRDAYTGVMLFSNQDSVWIPDKDGTQFQVIFVERVGRGTSAEHKRVYLDRLLPSWPTDEL